MVLAYPKADDHDWQLLAGCRHRATIPERQFRAGEPSIGDRCPLSAMQLTLLLRATLPALDPLQSVSFAIGLP
jgi:hypothetical protein